MIVGGVSGSGKTTLARDLARRIGGAHIELDACFHKPGWAESTDEEFVANVRAALAAAGGHLDVIRIRRPRDLRDWLRSLDG